MAGNTLSSQRSLQARSSTEVERCCLNIRGLRRAGWSQRYAPFSPDLRCGFLGKVSREYRGGGVSARYERIELPE